MLTADGRMLGVIDPSVLRMLGEEHALDALVIAADVMKPAFGIALEATLREAIERMIELGVRELPVLDAHGQVLGLLDELEISRSYLEGSANGNGASLAPPPT